MKVERDGGEGAKDGEMGGGETSEEEIKSDRV